MSADKYAAGRWLVAQRGHIVDHEGFTVAKFLSTSDARYIVREHNAVVDALQPLPLAIPGPGS
jgi:hypothetical protein